MNKVYSGKPSAMFQRLPVIKRKMKTVKKKPYKCKDGPFDNQTLYLTDGNTGVFTCMGFHGRYIQGEWINEKR